MYELWNMNYELGNNLFVTNYELHISITHNP
jgi:hypothetical protein